MKRLLSLLLFCALSLLGLAQDKHFTQFYASPLTLNPAMTGNFGGRYRLGFLYRDQWRGAFDKPYKTFSAAADVRFDLDPKRKRKDAVGAGLMFFKDEISGIDFVTNELAISGAYHKSLDRKRKKVLSLGIQFALAQRSVNYSSLTFDDQFNNIDSYNLPTNEALPPNNFGFSDLNIGVNYTSKMNRYSTMNLGAAVHHVFRPQMTFYEGSLPDSLANNKMLRRYSAQASFEFPVGDRFSMIPRALFASQGPHSELTAGSNFRVPISDLTSNAIQFGLWARPVRNEDSSLSLDAVIAMVGMELAGFLFGLSYDINIEDVQVYRQGQQSLELSVIYLGEFENESILCPKF